MTNEILSIELIEVDCTNSDGSIDWVVVANIADMRLLRPAIYYPAELAEPEEWGAGICSAVVTTEEDEQSPLSAGTEIEQIIYLQNMDLDWQLDEE
tara:strand:+ start:3263 stop:3550 length:288 start_codon:yes stop_codon:yes gene_type:complete